MSAAAAILCASFARLAGEIQRQKIEHLTDRTTSTELFVNLEQDPTRKLVGKDLIRLIFVLNDDNRLSPSGIRRVFRPMCEYRYDTVR